MLCRTETLRPLHIIAAMILVSLAGELFGAASSRVAVGKHQSKLPSTAQFSEGDVWNAYDQYRSTGRTIVFHRFVVRGGYWVACQSAPTGSCPVRGGEPTIAVRVFDDPAGYDPEYPAHPTSGQFLAQPDGTLSRFTGRIWRQVKLGSALTSTNGNTVFVTRRATPKDASRYTSLLSINAGTVLREQPQQ